VFPLLRQGARQDIVEVPASDDTQPNRLFNDFGGKQQTPFLGYSIEQANPGLREVESDAA
jgi:hypothetical protein